VKNRLMLKNINKTTKKNRVIVIGITVLEWILFYVTIRVGICSSKTLITLSYESVKCCL
jgi:hypothetical protein